MYSSVFVTLRKALNYFGPCDNSFSVDNTAKSVSRCSDMEDCKYVFVRFNAEKDLSHSAVLTKMVKPIWNTLGNVGNAARNGNTSLSTSLILEISLPTSVRFAKMHSIVSDS